MPAWAAKARRGATLLVAPLLMAVVGACAVDRSVETIGGAMCFGVGLDGVLAGSPTDPRVAWYVSLADGSEVPLVWPPNYRARFAPRLEILDGEGRVRMREGDPITAGCGDASGPNLRLLIRPQDQGS